MAYTVCEWFEVGEAVRTTVLGGKTDERNGRTLSSNDADSGVRKGFPVDDGLCNGDRHKSLEVRDGAVSVGVLG